ncbi:MAG: hypothetical protein M1822_005636 [Bathelium mastoideum]|nr:MAG: hypothetical protein M1822_005636 [Bathelium mastoideum]
MAHYHSLPLGSTSTAPYAQDEGAHTHQPIDETSSPSASQIKPILGFCGSADAGQTKLACLASVQTGTRHVCMTRFANIDAFVHHFNSVHQNIYSAGFGHLINSAPNAESHVSLNENGFNDPERGFLAFSNGFDHGDGPAPLANNSQHPIEAVEQFPGNHGNMIEPDLMRSSELNFDTVNAAALEGRNPLDIGDIPLGLGNQLQSPDLAVPLDAFANNEISLIAPQPTVWPSPNASQYAGVSEIAGPFGLEGWTQQTDAVRPRCEWPGCNVTFSRPYERDRHVQSQHLGQGQVWCSVSGCKRSVACGGKPFPRRDKLNEHVRRMHERAT